MPDSPNPGELTVADYRALRWLAIAWGVVIGTSWLVVDDARTCLLMTAIQIGILVATLGAVYLLRRWRRR